jgi:hypothetical protein
MSATLFIVRSELRLFEKTRNPIHLAHAERALQALMEEIRPRAGDLRNDDANIGVRSRS